MPRQLLKCVRDRELQRPFLDLKSATGDFLGRWKDGKILEGPFLGF